MVYKLLADLVLLVHLAFIIFVIFGGLLAIKNVKWAWLHIPAAVWAGLVEFAGWICPLTPLENWLCFRAGASTYQDSFIAFYLFPLIYPTELTRNAQILIGTGVVLISCLFIRLCFIKELEDPETKYVYSICTFKACQIVGFCWRHDTS
jgi:hypothetical protein